MSADKFVKIAIGDHGDHQLDQSTIIVDDNSDSSSMFDNDEELDDLNESQQQNIPKRETTNKKRNLQKMVEKEKGKYFFLKVFCLYIYILF